MCHESLISQGDFNSLAGDKLPGQNAVKGDKITHPSVPEQGPHSCAPSQGSCQGHGVGQSGIVGLSGMCGSTAQPRGATQPALGCLPLPAQ